MTREVKEALERLRPRLGARTDLVWAMYLSAERELRESLEQHVRLLDLRLNGTGPGAGPPPLPPPEPGRLAGWLRLGEVLYPNRSPAAFGLEQGELIQHVAIFGRSGAGKTNTVMCVLRELLSKKVPFLIFDWKRNYRDILAAPWVAEGEVMALTAGRDLAPLHLNPLRPPPGTEPRTWLKKIIEIIAHAYFLGEGVMFLLQEALEECYRKAGVFDGSGRYPTFRDVHEVLRARKVTGREANWMASTLRATGSLTYGPMAVTVCADEPDELRGLLDRNVILELDALTDSDKVFLVEALFLYIHHLRLAEPGRERLKHVILVEEAHHVFLRSKQELSGGEPITDVLLREIRELGEAVVLVDQHPSQIAITALGNTYCTIAMNLKHRADVNTIADACLLDPEQKEHLGRLPVGQAVVKLQDRWHSPFLVRFPHVALEKGQVTDAKLAGVRGVGTLRGGVAAIPAGHPGCVSVSPVPVVPKSAENLEDEADLKALLGDIADHPAAGVTERYCRLGLSRRRGTVLKGKALKCGLAREIGVALPGGRVTLLELTDMGWTLVRRSPPGIRHGGAVHRFWVARIAGAFVAQGFEVETEVRAGEGRSIDLIARRQGHEVAVEVEVSGRRLADSIAKLQGSSSQRRIVACASLPLTEKARQQLARDQPGETIEVVHVWSLTAQPENRKEAPVPSSSRGCGS